MPNFDESSLLTECKGYYSYQTVEMEGKIPKGDEKKRLTMGAFINMAGDVILPCFVGKHFNRSFSKLHLKAEKRTNYYKYRSFSKFDYFTNSSAWVRRDIFEKKINSEVSPRNEKKMNFNRQMMKKDRTALLLLDNYQGHK